MAGFAELTRLDATGQLLALAGRRISAVELLEASWRQSQALKGKLNAVVATDMDRARTALKEYHLAIRWTECQQFDTNLTGTYQWCPLAKLS